MADTFVNKVAESGIISLDLENFYPREEVAVFDMKDHLFMGLILKEKEFRQALKEIDIATYEGKIAAITCSADAVIPMWAYMLVASILQPVAADVIFSDGASAKQKILLRNIHALNPAEFEDKRIVIKGCGEIPMPEEAYIESTRILRPVAKSIMYGEPCSTVPVFKKEKVLR